MTQKIIRVGNIEIANDKPFVLFGGMNVLESRDPVSYTHLTLPTN